MQRRIDDPTPQVSFHRHLDSRSHVCKGCNLNNLLITPYISALAMLHHSVLQQVQLTSRPHRLSKLKLIDYRQPVSASLQLQVQHSCRPLLGVNLSLKFVNLYFPCAGWGLLFFHWWQRHFDFQPACDGRNCVVLNTHA